MKRNQVTSESSEDMQKTLLLDANGNDDDKAMDLESGATDNGTAVAPHGIRAETHLRSVLKGVTWRFVASTTTMSIAWMITGEIKTALEIGFIEVFAKIAIYYIHERIWARVRV